MAQRNPSAGFVLLDALVAFAIAAVTLTVIFATLPNSAVRQAERLNRHLATEFAFSVLEEYRVTFPQLLQSGADPSGWSWSIAETQSQTSATPLITYVDVSVSAWHRDRPDLRATLETTIARRRE